jgi:cytochrome bd-type quinol oxidase subunit 2
MIRAIVYWCLIALVVMVAWRRGSPDSRAVAAICVAASIGSLYQVSPWGAEASPIHPAIAAMDVLTLAAFVFIALRSEYFWPLWIAGLQLTTTMSHMFRIFYPDLVDVAYDAAMRMWSYPLLIILGIAAWRGHRFADRTDAIG